MADDTFKYSVIVNPNGDNYKTIQSAVDHGLQLQKGVTVKIAQGYYKENIRIGDQSVMLEPLDEFSEVYVISQNGPLLDINAGEGRKVVVKNLNMCYKGDIAPNEILVNSKKVKPEAIPSQPPNFQNDFDNLGHFIQNNFSNRNIININAGSVVITDSKVTMKLLQNCKGQFIANIFVNKNCFLNLINSHVQGQGVFNTTGVINYEGSVTIKNTKIFENLFGGVLCVLGEQSSCVVEISEFYNNGLVSIYLSGFGKQAKINDNAIYNNNCRSIHIQNSHRVSVIKNKIQYNQEGVVVVNSDCKI